MEKKRYSKKVVFVKNNGEIKVYNKQKDLAEELGIHVSAISNYVNKRYKQNKGYKIMAYDEYVDLYGEPKETKEKEEICYKTETMYYVNVLVGLANETLVDGAIYYVGGEKLIYRKQKKALVLFGDEDIGMLSRDNVLVECKVEYPLLTEEEKDFLKNLLKAFKDAKAIVKCKGLQLGNEFIRIEVKNPNDNIALPEFKEGKYYQSLKKDREYTLEELGL